MRIAELLAGKEDQAQVAVGRFTLPAAVLKELMNKGYENIVPDETSRAFSLWGKNCSACFTLEILQKAGGAG